MNAITVSDKKETPAKDYNRTGFMFKIIMKLMRVEIIIYLIQNASGSFAYVFCMKIFIWF